MVIVRDLLREQWTALRAWIEDSGLLEHLDDPSALEGWTVQDLITHTGQSFLAFTLLGPASGATPLSIRSYISHYQSAAQQIASGTRELSRSFTGDLLGGVDRCAVLGFRALDGLTAEVVRGGRGAITLDDFVLTRLLELVVHGDDLGRSVREVGPAPINGNVVTEVSQMLIDAYIDATGRPPEVTDEMAWIRLATGRTASDDTSLPLL
ncbi:maleylpyruvate isomerase N-terminal domain-containing protein [Aeromicrobium sp.]|uniref:maleylpyruvate isomerase N-terminal domain-containing protein n=1 Tax=Aeromicrobium sp. TaxID=1871063 RepID=UPI001994BEA5|nr:maleylpyruvate isomerase N-terminal domain-containing protein [Aeromicrobium sp.]MBC7631609.1 maleylpyruvate isomerase N-terminal domain-containing protein [Aeromicrobium sp.]